MENINERLDRIETFIQGVSIQHKEVLSLKEAATYLDISTSHLYKHTSAGNIPFSRPNNKKIYFKREDLENWLLQNRSKSNAEIECESNNYLTIKRN